MSEPEHCYAVIFSSRRTDNDAAGYERAASRMVQLASQQPGFIAIDSARNPDGTGITVTYWESEAAIRKWREHAEHAEIQEKGRTIWYSDYQLTIARVLRQRQWRTRS